MHFKDDIYRFLCTLKIPPKFGYTFKNDIHGLLCIFMIVSKIFVHF